MTREAVLARLAAGWRAVGEVIYGMTGFEFARHATQARGELETLLMLALFGDLIGLPIIPPYFALRILPAAAPTIPGWKRRVLRERHPLDNEEYDLIEM